MLKHVLLATDGSPSALAAARWVAGLGGQVPGLRVTLLHVLPDPAWITAMPDSGLVLPDAGLVGEAARREAASLIDATRQVLAPAPIEVDTRSEAGPAAEVIVRTAEASGCDLIAVGRRGLNPLAQLLMGSVSARVLQLAHCPVVVVHA